MPGIYCLYAKDWLILFFYIDDVVILCSKQNHDMLKDFEASLLKRFEMRSLGELKWFLGIRNLRDRDERKIWICQDSYISNVKGAPKTTLPVNGVPYASDEEPDPQRTHAS